MRFRILFKLLALVSLTITAKATAADFFAEVGLGSYYTSNVYLSTEKEWDLAFAPELDVGADFADYWSAGYDGRLDAYLLHRNLFFHRHELYLAANPAWGDDGENEMLVSLSVKTQRNAEAYSSINFLEPTLDLALSLEPKDWFYWSLYERVSYRWFYSDVTSDSLDSWTGGSMTFTMPSRTTLSPRFAYGMRFYPRPDPEVSDDNVDQQIEAGVHVSQGLWNTAGLQADWAYLHCFGESGLIEQKLTDMEFSYIGEEFLFSGHRAGLEFKQIFLSGWSFGIGAQYELRDFAGWLILDDEGEATDQVRQDNRLMPYGWTEYAWMPDPDSTSSLTELIFSMQYSYLRQWSNDEWYDTDRSLFEISLKLVW